MSQDDGEMEQEDYVPNIFIFSGGDEEDDLRHGRNSPAPLNQRAYSCSTDGDGPPADGNQRAYSSSTDGDGPPVALRAPCVIFLVYVHSALVCVMFHMSGCQPNHWLSLCWCK